MFNGYGVLCHLEVDPELIRRVDLDEFQVLIVEAIAQGEAEAWYAAHLIAQEHREPNSLLERIKALDDSIVDQPEADDFRYLDHAEVTIAVREQMQASGMSAAEVAEAAHLRLDLVEDVVSGWYMPGHRDDRMALARPFARCFETTPLELFKSGADRRRSATSRIGAHSISRRRVGSIA